MKNIANFINSELGSYEKYGILIQPNGTKLIGKAPHIAPQAWLHTLYRGLEPTEVKMTESELNTDIPENYAQFLAFSNGLNLFNTTLNLFGRRENYERVNEINARQPFALGIINIDEKPENSKDNYFFIGSYDWDGSLIFINKMTNKVHRCNRDDAEILNTWTDFNEFLKTEILRLKLLHNDNGTEIITDGKTIPD